MTTTKTFTATQKLVRDAYLTLATKTQDWVGLLDLRSHPLLAGIDRADVDAAITDLAISGDVIPVPESNRKVLTDAHHEAALHFGQDANHLIGIPMSTDADTDNPDRLSAPQQDRLHHIRKDAKATGARLVLSLDGDGGLVITETDTDGQVGTAYLDRAGNLLA